LGHFQRNLTLLFLNEHKSTIFFVFPNIKAKDKLFDQLRSLTSPSVPDHKHTIPPGKVGKVGWDNNFLIQAPSLFSPSFGIGWQGVQ
jgi:hypothetical protein